MTLKLPDLAPFLGVSDRYCSEGGCRALVLDALEASGAIMPERDTWLGVPTVEGVVAQEGAWKWFERPRPLDVIVSKTGQGRTHVSLVVDAHPRRVTVLTNTPSLGVAVVAASALVGREPGAWRLI